MNMIHLKKILIVLCGLLLMGDAIAQTNPGRLMGKTITDNYPEAVKKSRYKIAVITPMYLDSFDLKKNLINIPAYAAPGLDFYQGVMIAADTLKAMGFPLTISVFDSKSKYLNIATLLNTDKFDSMDCIIGNIGGPDLKLLVEYANAHKINFISAVSPADADQKNNPYFTLLQPRLATHIQRIYKKIDHSFAKSNKLFIRSKENKDANAFALYKNAIGSNTDHLISEIIASDEGMNISALAAKLSKVQDNIIVLGVLDAKLAYTYLQSIHQLVKDGFAIKILGMPTLENVQALSDETEFANMDIYYTNASMIEKSTTPSVYIQKKYKEKMGGSMNEIVYKGFESTYLLAQLMREYGVPFNEYYNKNNFSFITPYRIVPVKENSILKYYENNFLYLVRYRDGVMTYD
jgi:hypothetical protein